MAKKKTTEAINREQEVMEEKEALPSFFTNLFSSASNPLPNRAVLEYTIMHSAPVKANTEGYRAMMKVDKRTAEDIKHRLPCITPSVQLKGNAKKLTDFRKETYWLMLDYDDVPPEDIAELKKKALKQRFTMIFYITVSGKGFRILLRYMRPEGCNLTATELHLLAISLTSPSGESTSRIPIRAGTSTTFNFLFENTTVYIDYRLFVESTASELIHFRFSDAAPGIWKLVVEPVQIIDGRFHIWLPVREFLSGEVYFLNSNPYYTLTAPSDSVQPISVSYYDSSNNGLALSSGRGFTRTEQVKPDFTAPGISITGALPGGQFESRSGSSTSVGITAGAAALLVEWHLQQKKIPSVSTALIKSLLTLGATRNPDMKYPNREWGYGQLNLYNTFEAMRQL